MENGLTDILTLNSLFRSEPRHRGMRSMLLRITRASLMHQLPGTRIGVTYQIQNGCKTTPPICGTISPHKTFRYRTSSDFTIELRPLRNGSSEDMMSFSPLTPCARATIVARSVSQMKVNNCGFITQGSYMKHRRPGMAISGSPRLAVNSKRLMAKK